jgi:hypothetical protein
MDEFHPRAVIPDCAASRSGDPVTRNHGRVCPIAALTADATSSLGLVGAQGPEQHATMLHK